MNSRTKFILTVSSLLTFVTLILGVYKATAQRQVLDLAGTGAQDRVIVKKSDFDPPVKIVAVKTRKGEIEIGKAYQDDDDWLKGLTVGLVNESGKSVTHIDVEIQFRRPSKQSHEPPAGWHLEYGESPFRNKTGEPIPPVRVKPILPGLTFEITLSDDNFEQMWIFLKDVNYPPDISQIEVRVNSIGFSDGTAWGGRMLKRDPNSLPGWSPVEPPNNDRSQIRRPQGSE